MTTQHQVDKAKDLARSWQLQYEAERAEASGLRDQVQRLRQALQDVVEAYIDYKPEPTFRQAQAEAEARQALAATDPEKEEK